MTDNERRLNDCPECGFAPHECTCTIDTFAKLERALAAVGPSAQVTLHRHKHVYQAIVRGALLQLNTGKAYSESLPAALSAAFKDWHEAIGKA